MESSPSRSEWFVDVCTIESSVRKRKRKRDDDNLDDDDDVLLIVLKQGKMAYGHPCPSSDDDDVGLNYSSSECSVLCQREIQVSFSDMKKQLKLGKKDEYQELILKALKEMKNPIPESKHELIVDLIFREVRRKQTVFRPGIMVISGGCLVEHYDKHLDGPASLESIQQIMSKPVRLRVDEKREECAICFKLFVAEADVDVQHNLARLPCGHPYHKDCIRPWLEVKNHTCPICRFKMPTVLPLPISYTDDDDDDALA